MEIFAILSEVSIESLYSIGTQLRSKKKKVGRFERRGDEVDGEELKV